MTGFTEKSPAIVGLMKSVAGREREEGHCVFENDGNTHDLNFREDLSRREFSISGMCQACQDGIFGR